MSIDESLEWLISRKEHYEMDDSCQELAQALDIAIDIMRKYQKLEQEPRKDEVILTKEEYGELVSSEFDNGYAKGYREALEQEPTTKIDYRRAFKIACDLLNGDVLYGVDTDDIYELMMKKDGVVSSSSYEEYILNHLQELDQGQYASEPTTKNDLGVDCIDRQATLDAIIKRLGIKNETYLLEAERVIYQQILAMPSVTPQEPILDEIRDKIQAIYIGNRNGYGIMADVLKIIDKYRTESED